MKTNEAPEKIYLQENTTTDCYGEFWPEWFEARGKDTDIEYTRTDVFIKKACNAYCKVCKMPNCRSNECKLLSNFKEHLETT